MPTSSSHHLPTGHVLRGEKYSYRIERVLGQGTFGITYLASIQLEAALGALNAGVSVAVKEFFMKDLNDRNGTSVTSGSKGGLYDKYKERFAREAQNLGRLRHPHIVQVLESFAANNTFYYAMEYIGGGSLDDYIARRGALIEPEALRLVAQIGDALTYMHANKMLHLDLKPGNVVMRPDGAAVLIDFGLSKQYDEQGVPESSTTIGGGTPGYAPLEQAQYHEGRGFPTAMDVYALGATLFKMLTGQRPPEAADVLNDGFPAALLQARGVSTATIGCIARAMSPMKGQRYQTVKEFLLALRIEYIVPIAEKPKSEPLKAEKHTIDEKTTVDDTIQVESSFPHKKSYPNNAQKEKKTSLQTDTPQSSSSCSNTPDSEPSPILTLLKNYKTWIAVAGVALGIIIGISFRRSDYPDSRPLSGEKHIYSANGVEFTMVTVEGGTFTMGATREQQDPSDDEKPTHQVTLSTFAIGETEVTQALWQAVMGSNPSYFKGDNLPVEQVSWDDCQEFIRKLNALTGERFRLPTEAEWEYAARGGNRSKGYQYSGSKKLDDVAWYVGDGGDGTHPVGTKRANELGLYDMSGNVEEWCQDWYGSYSSSAQTDPTGPVSGSHRVYRGGGWYLVAWGCRIAMRYRYDASYRDNLLGFRLAL